jgi:ElaB/YqjD/DUF883 family membrane-anchored ribosome-binding protein
MDTYTRTSKEILTEIQTLIAEAETMAASSLSDHSTEALDNLRARFGAAQERFGEIYEGAKIKVVAGAKCADATIRENPYQSIAVALGLGVILGVIIGRATK